MALRTRVLSQHIAAAVESPPRSCDGYEQLLEHNWNGNVWYHGKPCVPSTLAELQEAVRVAAPPVRVVGRSHSFSPLAECAGGTLISLAKLNRVLNFTPPDQGRLGSLTVEGGTTYTEVVRFLGKRGALQNLPSCPQFTVAGAIATGTHGSGIHIQNLATQISAIEFVKADGSLVSYSREQSPELLEGCRVHLGCLGVVSQLTLDIVPYYEVDVRLYSEAPLDPVVRDLPKLWSSCDSLSVWCFGVGSESPCYPAFRHFVPHWDPALVVPSHTTPAVMAGVALVHELLDCPYSDGRVQFAPTDKGPWHDRLTMTMEKGEETPMIVTDIQTEFFVPISQTDAAFRAVREAMRDWEFGSSFEAAETVKGLVDAIELRQVKGDGAWMSPHPVDSLGIHLSFNGAPEWRQRVLQAVPKLERALMPFGVRAHWGKLGELCYDPKHVRELYGEGLVRFQTLCIAHDPHGKFKNVHVQRMLFGA